MMSQTIELSLDDLGHIIIPTPLQTILGLSPGMTLLVERGDNEGLRLCVKSQPSTIIEKKGLKVARVQPLTNLTNITRFEREYRVTELLQRARF